MRLTEATVDRYGVVHGFKPSLTRGITVLSGTNEAGKTLYLEALLQLLDPGVVDVLEPPRRYSEQPVGRVGIEYNGTHIDLGPESPLSAVTPIQPTDLQTIFVVRDNDLSLPAGPTYYTALIEHLGEIHTSTIESIISELKTIGRLTDVELNISTQYDNAGTVHQNATELVSDISAYLETVESENLDSLQEERLRLERDIRQITDELAAQRDAKQRNEYDRLSARLEMYSDAAEKLESLERFTRNTYEDLREQQQAETHLSDAITALEAEIESLSAEQSGKSKALAAAEEEKAELERREHAVEEAKLALETFRNASRNKEALTRQLDVAKQITIGGLLAIAIAGAASAVTESTIGILSTVGLGIVTLIAGGIAYRTSRQHKSIEGKRSSTIAMAQDAGFPITDIEAIAPAIDNFNQSLRAAAESVTALTTELESIESRKHEIKEQVATQQEELESLRQDVEDQLTTVGVPSVDAYLSQLSEREMIESECRQAEQSLTDAFGEPDSEHWEDRREYWAGKLAEIHSTLSESEIDAVEYSESVLTELESRLADLESKQDAVESSLAEYDEQINHFDTRVRAIDTQPFIGSQITLESTSAVALKQLQRDLQEVIDVIEHDAEVSRKAISIFEDIEAAEEQKIESLFRPNGLASEAFSHITNGRYTHLEYETESNNFVAVRDTGKHITPVALSEGTRDQLYFASRLSLASKLLDGQPGFLLLDEPFVSADPTRLRRGFETLTDLAADGWQIVYLTAKAEVFETMVSDFDLYHESIDLVG